jgi:glutamyl-tRNA reductase
VNIVVVGFSHKTASVEIREKLSISEAKIEFAFAQLLKIPHIEEVAIISTCNRLEIYAVSKKNQQGVEGITQFLSEMAQISLHQIQEHMFVLHNQNAISHLMRVAAGLESLVLGEGQILCQVKKAYQLAQTHQGLGQLLERLFKQAITAGKRVRTEIQISKGAVSISSAAVELAQTKVQDLTASRIAIIGAGEMARLLVQHLIAKGVTIISIINRSPTGAEKLAAKFPQAQLQLYSLPEMVNVISKSDIVFTSTSATKPILDREIITKIQPKHHLILVDISVPRNVNADVNQLEKVELYNVDDLQAVVVRNQENRRKMAQKAEILLVEEVNAFLNWLQSLKAVPTINSLRKKVESIREQELQKALSRLDSKFTQNYPEILEALTKGITNKILHEPMIQLRIQQDLESQRIALQTIQMLFNLDIGEEYPIAKHNLILEYSTKLSVNSSL